MLIHFPYAVMVPRSHTCPTCCAELARVIPHPDPHYGLPVVVCPRCTRACVRVRHPDQQFFRQLRRIHKSVRQLLLVYISSALSIGGLVGMTFWTMPVLTTSRVGFVVPDWSDPQSLATVLIATMIILLCGVMTRAIFAHRGFIPALMLILIPSCFFLSIDWSVGMLLRLVDSIAHANSNIDTPQEIDLWRRYLNMLIVSPVFIGGMIIGILVNKGIERSQRKRIVRLRRKLRKRQKLQD